MTDASSTPPLDCPGLRRYLLQVAERHLGPELRAKGGASDLVQDTLAAAHEALGQCHAQGPDEFRGWLRKILVNVFRQFRRRWRECQARDAALEVPLSGRAATELATPEEDRPSKVAQQNEVNGRLKEALARLPEDQRRAVVLRMDRPEASWEEIGQALWTSADAARMAWNRGLKRLQSLLRGVGG